MARFALLSLIVALLTANEAHAQAPARGDRYASSGQGTQRATDKCTFVYKARHAGVVAAQRGRSAAQ
jgi:hypothetical protein